MIRYGVLLVASLCSACVNKPSVKRPVTYPTAPIVPELPKSIREGCLALKPILEGSVKVLVETSASDAVLYVDCKSKFNEVVEKYDRVKLEQDSHRKQVERFNKQQ